MSSRLGMATLAALTCLSITACTPSGSVERSPASGSALSKIAWHAAGGQPVSQITEAGGRVGVYYIVEDSKLYLRALDLKTGHERWKVQASASSDITYLEPAIHAGKVGYLAPANGRTGVVRPAVVDAATGHTTTSKTPVEISSANPTIFASDDFPGTFTLYGRVGERDETYLWIHGPDLKVEDYDKAHPDREDNGLSFDKTTVSLKNGNAVKWSQPRNKLLEGASSTTMGYNPEEHDGVYEIHVTRDGSTEPFTANEVGLLEISASTGERLWLRWGVRPMRPTVPTADEWTTPTDITFLCGYTGTMGKFLAEPGEQAHLTDITAIRSSTGEELWTLKDVDECELASNDGLNAYTTVRETRTLIDLETGKTHPAPKDDVVWTRTRAEAKVGDVSITTTGIYEPLKGGDKLVETPQWPLPKELGVIDGNTQILVIGDEVRAYRRAE
ncbi:MAG: hypothetical protein ACRDS9_07835 [Pseudonocardiaceae bacterium]